MSRSKDIAEILGLTEAENTNNVSLGTGGGGVTLYDSSGLVLDGDSSGFSAGDLAYVDASNNFYIWNDSSGSWYEMTKTEAGGGGTPYSYQGSISGYAAGSDYPYQKSIEKYSFVSDGNGTNVADMTEDAPRARGHASSTHGYMTGGAIPERNKIEKFVFATEGNTTDIADLTTTKMSHAGISSADHGYTAGGYSPQTTPTALDTIDRFPFAADENATDVGDLTAIRAKPSGASGPTHGYNMGGIVPTQGPPETNIIEKFLYAATANATDVGDLTEAKYDTTSQNSSTHGYSSGATLPSAERNVIEKFPFATDENSTDVGDLTATRRAAAPGSSTTHGYTHGGAGSPSPAAQNVIDKFTFASDANATDVGDAHTSRKEHAGFQV